MALSRSQLKLSRDEIKEILQDHDIDGDGTLCKKEVVQALQSLGTWTAHQKAHYGVAFADEDGDGVIDEHELDKLVDYVMRFQAPKAPKGPKPPKKHCDDGKSIV